MIDFKINSENSCETIIDQRIFSQEVIFKSCNWFIDNFNFFYNQIDEHQLLIKIETKEIKVNSNFEEFKHKLNSYLNDYKTRELIFNQTKNIKDILLIKAFSSISDFKEEMISNE